VTPWRLEKGEEMGRFNMGSTLIVIRSRHDPNGWSNMKRQQRFPLRQPLAGCSGE